ncbi:MAG: Acetolactate synthase large subunit [Phycisphaerae bacterium]|nr:Acetolactate synthase large subunit [Phycisphaerae bacterium]
MKACDFIVKYLNEVAGIGHVFTYAGGTNAMLMDAMVRHGGLTIVPMRHEENAALAADGYARIKRSLGCALAMSGPGATNMVTGIAQSYFDSSPVFFLTGNVATGTYKYDRPLRQLGYQETDIVSIVRPITKAAYFVDRGDRVATVLREALRKCLTPRFGPCLYDIPFDTQKEEINASEMAVPLVEPRRSSYLADVDYEAFGRILHSSRRPVILAGGGIQLSDTSAALLAFARRYHLPVVSSLLGKDAFPNNDALYVGYIGAYGNRVANQVLAAADVVIALGSRIDSRQTANVQKFTENKQIIHVDIDPDVLGSTVQPTLALHMNLADFFEQLLNRELSRPLNWRTPANWLTAIHQLQDFLPDDSPPEGSRLNPKQFLRDFTRFLPDGTIYTVDVGSHQMWTAQCGVFKQHDRLLCSGGLGTMGYALPAAIGAHFAAPDRPLVAIVGDGGFQMSLPELQTIREFNVPVKIVVVNNTILGLMRNFQDENFNGRHPATQDRYSVPDITKVAAAFSIPAQRIEQDAQVYRGGSWLIEQDGPAILELAVDLGWSPYPKVLPGKDLTQQRPELTEVQQAKVREILYGTTPAIAGASV